MAAKLLFYRNSSGSVSCKVNLGTDKRGFTYTVGKRHCIRTNRGKDRDEYPFIVAFTYLDSFLNLNNVDLKDLKVDANSLDEFYSFYAGDKELTSVNLTPKFVETWWDYDCPKISRHAVNKDRHTNWFGLTLPYFSNTLVNWSMYGTEVDNTIRPKEAEKLTKKHENSHISQAIWNAINAQKVTPGEVEFLEEEIKKYEEKIQKVIDDHADEILFHIKDMKDGSYGLDCGWVNIYTNNRLYNERKGILKNISKDIKNRVDYLDVKMPFFVQSTTIQRKAFEKVQELVKNILGEDLYSRTVLD